MVKNPPANAGDARDMGSTPELKRSPGVGNGTPLQYSCLKNSMVRGAWQATIHGVAKSQTQLSTHTHTMQQPHSSGYIQRKLSFEKIHGPQFSLQHYLP